MEKITFVECNEDNDRDTAQVAAKVIALKDENKEIKEDRCSGFTQKYDVCSAENCFEMIDKGDAYDYSRANTELHKDIDIDNVGSGWARNHKNMTEKNAQDRFRIRSSYEDQKTDNGFAGPLRLMFLLLVGVLVKTMIRVGEDEILRTTTGNFSGQKVESKGGQGEIDRGGIVIAVWEMPTRLELENISLYNGNQGRLLFMMGDKRNIPPSKTITMIFVI